MKNFLFSTNSNIVLARSVAQKANLRLARVKVSKFADQEIFISLNEKIKGKSVFVLGATFPPAENMLELLILIHTLKVNGAKKITVVMPYFGYAKADRVYPAGTSFSAKLFVKTIEAAGAGKVIVIDMHGSRVPKLFKVGYTGLSAVPILTEAVRKLKIPNAAVSSTDKGSSSRAQKFAKNLDIKNIIYVSKTRPSRDEVKVTGVTGEVRGKNIILVDDMVQSGGTIIKSIEALKKQGAKNIYCVVTHLVSTGPSVSLLNKNKNIKQVIFTNTILPTQKLPAKFKMVKIDNLIVEALK